MLKSVAGIYRDGKVELTEAVNDVQEETQVIVTFLTLGDVVLTSRGIDPSQAADLRARLARFEEDWDSPEMDAYDDYDKSKSSL